MTSHAESSCPDAASRVGGCGWVQPLAAWQGPDLQAAPSNCWEGGQLSAITGYCCEKGARPFSALQGLFRGA